MNQFNIKRINNQSVYGEIINGDIRRDFQYNHMNDFFGNLLLAILSAEHACDDLGCYDSIVNFCNNSNEYWKVELIASKYYIRIYSINGHLYEEESFSKEKHWPRLVDWSKVQELVQKIEVFSFERRFFLENVIESYVNVLKTNGFIKYKECTGFAFPLGKLLLANDVLRGTIDQRDIEEELIHIEQLVKSV